MCFTAIQNDALSFLAELFALIGGLRTRERESENERERGRERERERERGRESFLVGALSPVSHKGLYQG